MRSSAEPRVLRPLADHLRARAVERPAVVDPASLRRDGRRRETLESVAELLEEDPALVRPAVRDALATFVLGPIADGDDHDVLGLRASSLVAAYATREHTTSVTHLRLLEALAVAAGRDAWEMAAEVGDVLLRDGSSTDELAAVVGLEVCETEAAIAGLDPGEDYFAHRADMTRGERRSRIAALSARVPV